VKRSFWLYWVDVALFGVLMAIAATALIMEWVVPAPEGAEDAVANAAAAAATWLGWNRHDWGELHSKFGFAFLALVIVHLGLHWAWIVASTARRLRRRVQPVADGDAE
jgi:hypothetical protein